MNNRSHAFTLTGNTLGQNPVQANVGSVGSSPCNSDYLIIPCASSKQGPVASGMNTCVDRLCGGTLNTDYTTTPTTVISETAILNIVRPVFIRTDSNVHRSNDHTTKVASPPTPNLTHRPRLYYNLTFVVFVSAGSVRPFRLSFHTNAVEMPNDMGNRGFCLNYVQQPCNANYS